MKAVRIAAALVLLAAAFSAVGARWIAPAGPEYQFRETPDAGPSAQHLLGTDELGRDRFARLVYGTRISLALAPLAALLTTALAALLGGLAGCFGGWTERGCMFLADLVLSFPSLFLLITVRAALPLNISPEASAVVTFVLLGLLGWAASARVVCAGTKSLMQSDFVWNARAAGFSGFNLVRLHLLPNLRGPLLAQFWISIPIFIIAEANLSAMGLGVPEPLPSLGGLLREIQSLVMLRPEPWRFVPVLVLVLVVISFEVLLNKQEVRA
jgi:peptide/nickel transport system permease protein